VLTGADGRLGSAAAVELPGRGIDLLPIPGPSAGGPDLCGRSAAEALGLGRGDVVMNAAALSMPSSCRADPSGALALNSLWPAALATVCRDVGARLVHVSSDLVYSGGNPPYVEQSSAVPRSFYGWTKLLGDRMVSRICPGALIVRTSVLFGRTGALRPTFSEELLAGSVKSVHVDCWRNHTPVHWFAGMLLEAGSSSLSGLLLLAGRYSHTRAAFAETLLRAAGADSLPVQGYRPAGTPADLTLDCSRAADLLGRDLPDLAEAIEMEHPRNGRGAALPVRPPARS
jgi:dTDP-4-dehydrorhamnose reductase